MSCNICHRCKKNNIDSCSLGFNKTEEQIIREKYNCFEERIYRIDPKLRHPDYEYDPYQYEMDHNAAKFHMDMRRAERKLRKSS